jgi:hypothetical protein
MPDQNPQHGRRPHFHRGRRGPDRRGNDRRIPPAQEQAPARDQVDVEQIMREIRSRISQRHGIDLSTQQIQELAARRLEAILDPRTVKPSLLEQLRRSAGSPIEARPADPALSYSFEATTLYESPSGFVRFMRRLLQPVLKLFFNPNPLIQAMNTQARINQAALAREAERERRQAEWNALHYDILQRLVIEISRTSLEGQGLSMRVESLAAKVDFNERRVRGMENTAHQARPAQRPSEPATPPPPSMPTQPREGAAAEPVAPAGEGTSSEGGRRRRRRRRGRRSPMGTPFDGSTQPPLSADRTGSAPAGSDADTEPDHDEDEDESASIEMMPEPLSTPASGDEQVASPPAPEPTSGFDPFASTETRIAPVAAAPTPEPSSSATAAPPTPDDDRPREPRDPSGSGTT